MCDTGEDHGLDGQMYTAYILQCSPFIVEILGCLHSTFLTSISDEPCWCPGVGKILGYVATGYGANNFTFNYPGGSTNRTLPVVLSYIDMYYTTYKCNTSVRLDGIFLDEAATWVRQQTHSTDHNRTDNT
jgi:hypothetical protein